MRLLLGAEPIDPLPVDSGCYVPVLQNRKGELDALRGAAPETWERMTPLVEIVGPKDKAKVFQVATVRAWLKRIAEVVGTRPVYIDLVRLNPIAKVATARGTSAVLREVYVAARRRNIRFVPVLPVGENAKAQLATVREAVDEDGHGVALRYRFLNAALPSGLTRSTLLANTLSDVACAPEEADLLLDLDYIDPDVDIDIAMLGRSIEDMAAVGAWRSVVLIGTTIPETLSCIKEGTVGTLPRREWEVWTQLAARGLKRTPAFGDYAVQHPHPPQDEGGPGMRANIRYTTDAVTLVPRGKGSVIQEGREQYHDLCRKLVALKEFSGRAYTWGDEVIEDCAKELIDGGSQGRWRGAGTSHHLRFVTDQLRARGS